MCFIKDIQHSRNCLEELLPLKLRILIVLAKDCNQMVIGNTVNICLKEHTVSSENGKGRAI